MKGKAITKSIDPRGKEKICTKSEFMRCFTKAVAAWLLVLLKIINKYIFLPIIVWYIIESLLFVCVRVFTCVKVD